MSQITIQCRLVAPAYTRQQHWMLMAEANTPLINELLEQVRQHSDFEVWRSIGKIPAGMSNNSENPSKPVTVDNQRDFIRVRRREAACRQTSLSENTSTNPGSNYSNGYKEN